MCASTHLVRHLRAPRHCTRGRCASFARRVFCAQAGPHLPHPAQRIVRNLSTLYRVHSLCKVNGACRRLRHRFMRCLHSRCVLPHLLTQSGIADGAAPNDSEGMPTPPAKHAVACSTTTNLSHGTRRPTKKANNLPATRVGMPPLSPKQHTHTHTHTHTVHVRPNTPAAMRRVFSAICRTTAWRQGEATRAFQAPGDD